MFSDRNGYGTEDLNIFQAKSCLIENQGEMSQTVINMEITRFRLYMLTICYKANGYLLPILTCPTPLFPGNTQWIQTFLTKTNTKSSILQLMIYIQAFKTDKFAGIYFQVSRTARLWPCLDSRPRSEDQPRLGRQQVPTSFITFSK